MKLLKCLILLIIIVFIGYVYADKNRPLLVLPVADSLSIGVVEEGDSLPIGVSLNDSRDMVQRIFAELAPFNATIENSQSLTGRCNRQFTQCRYTAVSLVNGEVLGSVVVFYKRIAGESRLNDTVRKLSWTFTGWKSQQNLSLADLSVITQDQLENLYPNASRINVNILAGVNFNVSLFSPADGLEMRWTINGRSGDLVARGSIFLKR